MASLTVDSLYRAWGLLVLAGLGIGGIVVPASIITTIICPDVCLLKTNSPKERLLTSMLGPYRNSGSTDTRYPRYWRFHRLYNLLQCLRIQIYSQRHLLHWRRYGA